MTARSRAPGCLPGVPGRLAVALVLLVPAWPARAQEPEPEPTVELTLLAQTPFATPDRPARLRLRATNGGHEPLAELSMSLWVYFPARSRSEYGRALESEPPSPLLVAHFTLRGVLRPQASRTFTIERPLPELGDESALYPIKVQLESGGVPVGVLRSALVFIHERPLVPLPVSFTFVLDEPVALRPDGAFADDALQGSMGDGGRLDTILDALEAAPMPLTLAVSPLLLEELSRMSAGYRAVRPSGTHEVERDDPGARQAAATLERIRRLASSSRPVEVVALPYAGPSVPALVDAGLPGDLAVQIERGRRLVGELLEREPVEALFRPPRAELTREALSALAGLGVDGLLVDASTLPPPAGLNLSPPATARVGAGAGRALDAVTPDPGLADRIKTGSPDPRLRTVSTLGELAAIYFEQPSVAERGVAILFDERAAPERGFMRSLLRSVAAAPPRVRWLRPVPASSLLSLPPPHRRTLAPSRSPGYSPGYLAALAQARGSIAALQSVAEDRTRLPDRLRTLVLVAEARDFLGREPVGLAFAEAVRSRVDRELGKVEPPPATTVTLTSRGGVLPVTIRNLAGYPLRVRIALLSSRLRFLEGDSLLVVLSRPAQRFTFPVRAQTTGRFPVRVLVETPDGSRVMASSRIVVRSTAYNRVALVVTVGAALFLALWWARRFLPRARS